MLSETARYINLFVKKIGELVSWLIYLLIFIIAIDLSMRYFFSNSLIWAYDSAYMIYGFAVMMGGAYTGVCGMHIRVDVFYDKFSDRKKAIVNLIYLFVFYFPLIIVLIWGGVLQFVESWQFSEISISSPWHHPISPYKAVVPIAFFLLLLNGITELIENLELIRYKRKTL